MTVALFGYNSCGKKEAEKKKDPRFTTKQEKISENKPEYLLNGLTIGGFRINDTANHIKVNIFTPVIASKEVKYSLKPITEISTRQFKDFVRRAKEREKHDSIFHCLDISTVFVNSNGNLVSALLKQTEQFVEEEETTSYFGVTYRKNAVTSLPFPEVFPLNEKSFADFKQIFSQDVESYGLKDFENCSFAIGRDSLFVFISQSAGVKQAKLAADILQAEAFMAHGK